MTGYFRLKRGIFEHTIFQTNEKFTKREAWIWLIEQANFSDSKFRHKSEIHTIPRGSLASSYRAIARAWQWSTDRVIRELNLWEKEGMVVRETRHGYLQITLCKYGFYQASPNADATLTRQQHDTDATATSTNQIKVIKEKKEIKEVIELPPWLDSVLWDAFKEMRRGIKSPMTTYAERLMLNKLEKLRQQGHDPTALLEESIRQNWKDIYLPKENIDANSRTSTGKPEDSHRSSAGTGRTVSSNGKAPAKRSQWEIAGADVIAKIRSGEF